MQLPDPQAVGNAILVSMKNSEPTASVAELCDHAPWTGKSLLLRLYLPLGAMLMLARVLVVSSLYCVSFVLPDSVNRRLYRFQVFSLGIRVKYNLTTDEIQERTNGCVVAANHVSALDTFTVLPLPQVTIMVGNPLNSLNFFNRLWHSSAFKFSGAQFWLVSDRREFARRLKAWRQAPQGTSLYTTPEMTINNQRGIFKFSTAFVCLDMPVVPLALTVQNSFGLKHHPVNSSSLAIFLRLLMMPRISFTLSYLAKTVRQADESKEDFANRIQHTIASHLRVAATQWTAADKHAYRKSLAAK